MLRPMTSQAILRRVFFVYRAAADPIIAPYVHSMTSLRFYILMFTLFSLVACAVYIFVGQHR
jgi:hypothetical protein